MYFAQVELLLDVLPVLNQFECCALKGGTAINLFIRNMPRLSVDIDLTYLPIEPRDVFLKKLKNILFV
jgi:predicted nucleotidyltransferase component of viral defense system